MRTGIPLGYHFSTLAIPANKCEKHSTNDYASCPACLLLLLLLLLLGCWALLLAAS